MSPELGDIYRGSNASDFQPETRNPQSDVGGGLQPVQNNLQPGGNQAEGSQQFPSVQKLEVLGVENPGSANQTATATTVSQPLPIGLLVALGVLIFIAAALAWLARPAGNSTPTKVESPKAEPDEKPQKKTTKKKKTSRKKRKAKK